MKKKVKLFMICLLLQIILEELVVGIIQLIASNIVNYFRNNGQWYDFDDSYVNPVK